MLQPYGTSVGRKFKSDVDIHILDPFLNDYARILQSKAYRRLADKTQVMCYPDNPHVRTRLVHTNEVVILALAISEQLGLNNHLCMAIAAGHDLGHTPFGHLGESVFSKYAKDFYGEERDFKHNVNSVVVAQKIERRGRGLNLTFETLEGILHHSRGAGELITHASVPNEYTVVMFADKIAYTFSDLNDAIRYGYLKESEIPHAALKLGLSQRRRTKTVIDALVRESKEKGRVSFSEGKEYELFKEVKDFMFQEVYFEVDWEIQRTVLRKICEFFAERQDTFGVDPIVLASLLTDKEVIDFGSILLKTRKPGIEKIRNFGIFEIYPHIPHPTDGEVDYSNPDLNWKDQAHPDNFINP